jgi:hypothetical protein
MFHQFSEWVSVYILVDIRTSFSGLWRKCATYPLCVEVARAARGNSPLDQATETGRTQFCSRPLQRQDALRVAKMEKGPVVTGNLGA